MKIIFKRFIYPFQSVSTEYKFLQALEHKELFKKPSFCTINDEVCEIVIHNSPAIASNKVTGVIMPFEFYIKKNFEFKNVLQQTLANMETTNFVRKIIAI